MIINLTSAAVILWSGMLIIAGTLLVLSSQVRHLVELLEKQQDGPATATATVVQRPTRTSPNRARNAGPRTAATTSRNVRRYATASEFA